MKPPQPYQIGAGLEDLGTRFDRPDRHAAEADNRLLRRKESGSGLLPRGRRNVCRKIANIERVRDHDWKSNIRRNLRV